MMKRGLIALISAMFLASAAKATELWEYQRPIKALGMGAVYLPFITPTDAVIWNPGALADVTELSWEIMDIHGGLGGPGATPQEMIENFQSMGSCSGGGSNCFSGLYGKPIWFSAGGKTSFAAPGFGFAGYNFTYLQGALNNPAYPNFDMTFINDYGFSIGGAFHILPNTSLGMAVKRISRWGGEQSLGLSTISSGNSQAIADSFTNRGTAYGIDLGSQTKIELGPMATVLGVSWQDVGGTAFTKTDGLDAPPHIDGNLSAGLGTTLDLPGLDLKLGTEIRHLLQSSEQFGKKFHLGAEVGLPFIDIRAGLNQGYMTYGATFEFFFLDFDIASYTEETGAYPGQTPENRIALGVTMSLSVDADFKFTSKDGKKRKLKQRR